MGDVENGGGCLELQRGQVSLKGKRRKQYRYIEK